MDFLRTGGSGTVPAARDRAGYAAPVSLLGVSMGAGNLCRRRAGVDPKHFHAAPGTIVARIAAHRGGTAFLSILEPVSISCQGLEWRLTAAKYNIGRARRQPAALLREK